MDVFLGVLIIAIAYFLPFCIALARDHHNKAAVFMLNLLLGWTFLGWVVALVWSFTNPPAPAVIAAPAAAQKTRAAGKEGAWTGES